MSTNPVLIYTEAKKRFDTAHKHIFNLARNVHGVTGSLLNNWRSVIVPGVPTTGATVNSSAFTFNKADWPTGDQIAAAIIECHQAFHELLNAYRAMLPADQSALCPDGEPKP